MPTISILIDPQSSQKNTNTAVERWLVASNTVDDCPDDVVLAVANDALCMAALKAGFPVLVVRNGPASGVGNA